MYAHAYKNQRIKGGALREVKDGSFSKYQVNRDIDDTCHDWLDKRGEVLSFEHCGINVNHIPTFIRYAILCESLKACKKLKERDNTAEVPEYSVTQRANPFSDNTNIPAEPANSSTLINYIKQITGDVSTIEDRGFDKLHNTSDIISEDITNKTLGSPLPVLIRKYKDICLKLFPGKNFRWFALVCDAELGKLFLLFREIIRKSIQNNKKRLKKQKITPEVLTIEQIIQICRQYGIMVLYLLKIPQTIADSAYNQSYIPCLTLYRFPVTHDRNGNKILLDDDNDNDDDDDLPYPMKDPGPHRPTDGSYFRSPNNLFSQDNAMIIYKRGNLSGEAAYNYDNGKIFQYIIKHTLTDAAKTAAQTALRASRAARATAVEAGAAVVRAVAGATAGEDGYRYSFLIQYGLRNIPAMAAAPPAAGAAAVGPAPNILTYLETGPTLFQLLLHYMHLNLFNIRASIFNTLVRNSAGTPILSFKNLFSFVKSYDAQGNAIKTPILLTSLLNSIHASIDSWLGLTPIVAQGDLYKGSTENITFTPAKPYNLWRMNGLDEYHRLPPAIMVDMKRLGDEDAGYAAAILNSTGEFKGRTGFSTIDRLSAANAAKYGVVTIKHKGANLVIIRFNSNKVSPNSNNNNDDNTDWDPLANGDNNDNDDNDDIGDFAEGDYEVAAQQFTLGKRKPTAAATAPFKSRISKRKQTSSATATAAATLMPFTLFAPASASTATAAAATANAAMHDPNNSVPSAAAAAASWKWPTWFVLPSFSFLRPQPPTDPNQSGGGQTYDYDEELTVSETILVAGMRAAEYLSVYKHTVSTVKETDQCHEQLLTDLYEYMCERYSKYGHVFEEEIYEVSPSISPYSFLFKLIMQHIHYQRTTVNIPKEYKPLSYLQSLIVLCNIHNEYYGEPVIEYTDYIKQTAKESSQVRGKTPIKIAKSINPPKKKIQTRRRQPQLRSNPPKVSTHQIKKHSKKKSKTRRPKTTTQRSKTVPSKTGPPKTGPSKTGPSKTGPPKPQRLPTKTRRSKTQRSKTGPPKTPQLAIINE
jgi:hypothetical protein